MTIVTGSITAKADCLDEPLALSLEHVTGPFMAGR